MKYPPRWLRGLSARLLVLTAVFVMLSEVLIYVPSIARFRLTFLQDRIADAHLASLALKATPDNVVSRSLEDIDWCHPDWPDDLCQVIYLDHYGNAITGLRATGLSSGQRIAIAGHELHQSRTFGEVTPGQAFWYENANGLVEIAVNQGSAAQELNLTPGTSMTLL